jgi:hypothetical protein
VVENAVADRAQEVLRGADFLIVDVREVLVVPLEDQPGGLASVTRTAYEARAGVYLLSLATGNRVMLGVANLEAAQEAFGL